MKRIFLALVLILSVATVSTGDTVFTHFSVEEDAHRAIITWSPSNQIAFSSFVVERSYDGVEFYQIATFTPNNPGGEYRYIDVDLFKDSVREFHYRIKGVDQSEQEYFSLVERIEVSISGIRQTWGSLKALFR